ncbi:unnamed protein product [Acanthoscelides obtectus]|uniref:Uncharacterized protein n=1 Tax=Acanthoscelides obtectus TaxID=200917 RepID=A0A9P0LCB0_ACAOB|nr:unnamed protein product [Acanthoscelides obtectus]CAK1655230.1 hypothetical protein AOBTE_LOCUS19089 [Acanthoscelides obtectus]
MNQIFKIVQYILLIDELNLRTAAIAVPPTTETDVIQDRCCGLNTEEAIFTDSQLDVPVIENIMNCSPSPTTMSTDNHLFHLTALILLPIKLVNLIANQTR